MKSRRVLLSEWAHASKARAGIVSVAMELREIFDEAGVDFSAAVWPHSSKLRFLRRRFGRQNDGSIRSCFAGKNVRRGASVDSRERDSM